jgi:hypothetical protein
MKRLDGAKQLGYNCLVDQGDRVSDIRLTRYLPFAIFVVVLAFYLATLAPTVLWGDEAYFQRTAFEGELKPDGGGHWLWLRAAQLFVKLPWGDVAYRVNLLSAVAAALTILLMYAAGVALDLSSAAATAVAASLAVAHTFWFFAVRAEVYTVFTLLMALQLWLWLSWRRDKVWPILTAAFLFGIVLLGHQMAVLLMPAFAYLLWKRRTWLSTRQWVYALLLLVVGVLPFFVVIQWQSGGENVLVNLRLHFTHSSEDFTGALFDFSLTSLPRDAAMWIGLLGLQFIGLSGLFALWGVIDASREGLRAPWSALVVLFVTAVVFAFSYHVNDQFVFFLPSYLVFALFVGRGWHAAWGNWSGIDKRALQLLLIILFVVVPIVSYNAMPRLLAAADINPMGIRELPGRNPNSFFLWPAKNGYLGAADYARAALWTLPAESVLIADYTPAATIHYLKSVEGLRPDVRLYYIGQDRNLAQIVEKLPPGAKVFLADNNPDYYNLHSLPDMILKPVGVVYQLLPSSP